MQQTKVEQARKVLRKKISSVKGRFTLHDAASLTGLSVEEVQQALDKMMEQYQCRLTLTDEGALIYDFGRLRRRGSKTAGEIAREFAGWLYKAFKVVFKIWITVMLIVYFVIFMAILIGIMLSGRSRDSKSSFPLGRIFFVFFNFNSTTGRAQYHTSQGYRYRSLESRKSLTNPNKKSLIASVYDFVFGPERVKLDPLSDAREAAAYLKEKKGIITPGEIVALSGRFYEVAETFLSDIIIRFQGEVRLSDNGVVYGHFHELLQTTGLVEDEKIEYYWDEYEAPYEMTGNKSSRNALIGFFNAFNLVFSTYVLYAVMAGDVSSYGVDTTLIAIGLGLIPFAFSCLFFLIPLLRYLRLSSLRRQRETNNISKRILGYIFSTAGKADTVENILAGINNDREKKSLDLETLQSHLDRMLPLYAGETRLMDDGKVLYAFDRIESDYKEAARLRSRRQVSSSPGSTIFET